MSRSMMPLAWRRILRIAAAAIIYGLALASCSSGRLQLSTGAAQCFEALPIAQKAVTSPKIYYGVRLISQKTAESILSRPISPGGPDYCLIAYRLKLPQPTSAPYHVSRFALVVVEPKAKQVLGIRDVRRLPFSFRRSVSVN
ncbi:MAG: hypothetical protein EPN30_05715 [Actinomycetota bacterium]|nr:MAG: hypothetical protein EPN30_05715 [Actinomycetota bacterium]